MSKWRQASKTDALTGAGNRRALEHNMRLLTRKLKSRVRRSHNLEGCIVSIDLDLFKPINDNYGMSAGDQVIQEIATRLSGLALEHLKYSVDRAGGDEFYLTITDPRSNIKKLNWCKIRHPLIKRENRYAHVPFETVVVGLLRHQLDVIVNDIFVIPSEGEQKGEKVKVNLGLSWGIAFFGSHSFSELKNVLKTSQEDLHDNKREKKERLLYLDRRRLTGRDRFETLVGICKEEDKVALADVDNEVLQFFRDQYKLLLQVPIENNEDMTVRILDGGIGNNGERPVYTASEFRELLEHHMLYDELRYFNYLVTGVLMLEPGSVVLTEPHDSGRGSNRNLPAGATVGKANYLVDLDL